MNIKTIIARFLPLLDVTVVLLGLMMVLMAYAQFEEESARSGEQAASSEFAEAQAKPGVRIIYLYGNPDGSCHEFDPAIKEKKNRIATDSDKDIRSILDEQASDATWLLLFTLANDKHEGKWSQQKISTLKKTWKLNEKQKLFELGDAPF